MILQDTYEVKKADIIPGTPDCSTCKRKECS